MKISFFLKVMFVVTFMAVLYIHLQMKIYDFAYQGKVKQQRIEQLAEVNGRVHNDILRLQSSDNIGRELLGNQDSKFQFASRSRVIEVASENTTLPEMIAHGAQSTGGFLSRVVSLAFAAPHETALSH
ncbi:MAG: hypothetical protein HQL16_04465 [Candidatus Omnitrophica bacterium]|nr:hypothetical protein [Candidatus Omnitrophota bacterium]